LSVTLTGLSYTAPYVSIGPYATGSFGRCSHYVCEACCQSTFYYLHHWASYDTPDRHITRYSLPLSYDWGDPQTAGAFCPYKKLTNGTQINTLALIDELYKAEAYVQAAANITNLRDRGITVTFAVGASMLFWLNVPSVVFDKPNRCV
jgi:hypothetical protein